VTTGGTIAKALTLHFALEREKMKEEMNPKRKRKRRKRRRRREASMIEKMFRTRTT
jgi:hypothetical protein